jgi:uncharacterized metal-binding protein
MSCKQKQVAEYSPTEAVCPIGEKTGKKNIEESIIPVLSCEGGCIRGEIARLAANYIIKEPAFGQGCHGELITVPQSSIAKWIREAEKVVLIDGCFLRCHGRILENIIDADKLVQFDALSHYNRYTDIFDYDDVPEEERKEVARSVADWVLESLANPGCQNAASPCCQTEEKSACCCG